MLNGSGHRLEEPDVVFGRRRLPLRRAELREQSSELRPPRGLQLLDRSGHVVPGAERIHPRAERQDLLAFVRAPEQDLAPRLDGLVDQRLDQPGLADSRFPLDQADGRATAPRIAEPLPEGDQLDAAPDQGGGRGREMHRPAARLFRASGPRPSLEELAIRLLGLGLGLDAELAFEGSDTELVLSERRAAPILARVDGA